MDDQRVGRVVRALRRRRGWRQVDLAKAAGCSQNVISFMERGHLDATSTRLIRRVAAALDAQVVLDIRWRGAGLERLLDEDHSQLANAVADELTRLGWEVRPEVSYSAYGERGSIDLLAWHAPTRMLLVIEIKTDLPSAEATLRKLDEKTRLSPAIATERFNWRPTFPSRLLIVPSLPTLRRRVELHAIFRRALPSGNVAVRRWLSQPVGPIAGLWFFSDRDGQIVKSAARGPQRVRRRKGANTNRSVAG